MPGSALRPDFPYSYRLLTVLAGTYVKKEVQISGEKIVYASPTTGVELGIRLESSDQDAIPLRPNGEIVAPYSKFFIDGTVLQTTSLLVAAPAGIQLTGRDVIVSGVVSTIVTLDKEDYLAQQGLLWSASAFLNPAAQFASYQLKNPAGSGKIATLLRASIRSTIALDLQMGAQNTDNSTGNLGVNHKVGSAVAASAFRTGVGAGAQTPSTVSELASLLANTPADYKLSYDLDPGEGWLIATNAAVTAGLLCTMFWTERNQ